MSHERILVVHNAYQQHGGEDMVVDSEVALLRSHGHAVTELRRHNDDLSQMGRAAAAAQMLWSRATRRQAQELIRAHRPDVVHVHNTLALISPSVYWACAQAGVPVVQTLHNFRLACPQAMFLRNDRPCEDCLGRLPLPAIRHGCYRGSRPQTAVLSAMLVLHRGVGTWQRKIDRYIALNQFCRGKFIEAGLPAEHIVVKPNFVDIAAQWPAAERDGFLFVGRLSAEKGIGVLAQAWASGGSENLRVVGSGGEAHRLRELPRVAMLGQQPSAAVQAEMRRARALLLPSICYENFPRTMVEAFACGLPVIASRTGSLAELIRHGQTGLLFEPGSADDLSRTLRWANEHPDAMNQMGRAARIEYEHRYTADRNYQQLVAIYREAAAHRAS